LSNLDKDQAQTIIKALRAGTVPDRGLEHFAVGLDREMTVLTKQLDYVAKGHGDIKFVRGDFGSGKTFLTSLVGAEALNRNFVVSKVVISQGDTPLYKFEEVYRKICQNMLLPGNRPNALSSVLERWFYNLEEQVREFEELDEDDPGFLEAVNRKVDSQLQSIGDKSGRFASCIKAFHRLQFEDEFIKARGLLDWMCGDKKVAATAKKEADIKGDLTKNDVYTFLRGMLELFRKAGHPGLLLVLDEVETIRHYNKNLRGKALEVLRDIVDKVLSNNLPGLLLMVTGTPALYESEEGIPALEPLNQRVKVTFGDDPSTDNLRQTQIRLHPLDSEGLNLVAHKIREIYPADHPERLQQKVDDDFIDHLLNSFEQRFGERLGVSPRLFLRAVVDILDRVDQYDHFDPYTHDALSDASLQSFELSSEEQSVLETLAR
jgi:hypothetical protein